MTSWNGNEALYCFLKTGGKLLLKLLHIFALATLHVAVCGTRSVCMCVEGGVRGVTADLLTWDSVSLIKS